MSKNDQEQGLLVTNAFGIPEINDAILSPLTQASFVSNWNVRSLVRSEILLIPLPNVKNLVLKKVCAGDSF